MINLQKQLTRVMEEFTNGLYEELREIEREMASQTRDLETFHRKMMNQAESWKVKIQGAFDLVAEDIQVNIAPYFDNYAYTNNVRM
jgi:hypothetical protein